MRRTIRDDGWLQHGGLQGGGLQDDRHRGKAMTYEFRTAEGRVCCKGNDFQLLCESCKAKATASQGTTATGGVPPAVSQN